MGQGRGSCRVAAARSMPEERRVAACSQIVQDHWRDECWFELAEDRAGTGAWADAADACANAGEYRVDCARHLYQGRGGDTTEHRSLLLRSVPEAEAALALGADQVAGTQSAVEAASAARVAAGRANGTGAPWEAVAYDVAASCPPGAAPDCADNLAQRLTGRWRRAAERQPAVRASLCDGGMPPAGFSWAPHATLDAAMEQVRADVCVTK